MSGVRTVLLIAIRDFVQRIRSRAFLVSLLLVVGIIAFTGPFIALGTREPPPYVVGVVGEPAGGLTESLTSAAAAFDRRVDVTSFVDATAGEAAVRAGTADVLVVDGRELVWHQEPSLELAAIAVSSLQTLDRLEAIAELGLTTDEVARMLDPPAIPDRVLQDPDPEADIREAGAFIGTFLLYLSIVMFGQFVMMGVMEEKSSRVIEVVLCRARPHQLIAGKVLGIGALGLLQLVILAGAGLAVLLFVDVVDIDLTGIGLEVAGSVFIWYLMGFAFFSVLNAALGATVSRQEDAQSVAVIPVLVLLPGYFLSIMAIELGDALLVRIASFIPLFSPFVMPMRAAVGDVPPWEIGLAMAILLASTYGMVRLAGRVYRGSILRIGARVKLRDAWLAARR